MCLSNIHWWPASRPDWGSHSRPRSPAPTHSHQPSLPAGAAVSSLTETVIFLSFFLLTKPGSPDHSFLVGAPRRPAWAPQPANWSFSSRCRGSGRDGGRGDGRGRGHIHSVCCISRPRPRLLTRVTHSPPACPQGSRPHTPADAQTRGSCEPQCTESRFHRHTGMNFDSQIWCGTD